MARPWSARCYGVARHREGSRQNSRRGLGRALSPAFRAGSLYPLSPLARGCRRIWRGVILVYWFRRGRGCRPHDGEVAGGAVADLGLLISGPRDNTNSQAYPRERARMARPWSAGCYGVARHREGSRQNSRKTRRLLANRPCSSLVYEESDSKERLRVSNWIVQRLYNYAVKKTVEL